MTALDRSQVLFQRLVLQQQARAAAAGVAGVEGVVDGGPPVGTEASGRGRWWSLIVLVAGMRLCVYTSGAAGPRKQARNSTAHTKSRPGRASGPVIPLECCY